MRILRFAFMFLLTIPAVDLGYGRDLEYRNFILSNGMKIIMRENHDNPLIASLIYVHAGSAYERQWNNGVSHLLEHLLFDGTRERSREDINEGVKELGGYINAFTRDLYTSYILLVPTEHIEEGLSLQKDMLFHSIIPDKELEKERKVVIEEIRKDEASPYYIAERFHREKLFTGTPYALPVVGYPNVISTITRDEIVEYYNTYYVPNNMTILLMGDFYQDEMLELIETVFGDVPSKTLPPRTLPEMKPPVESYLSMKGGDTSISYITVSFLCPPPYHKDFNALNLLSRYLSQGEDSPLNRSLVRVERPLALSVSSSISIKEGFSVLDITIFTMEREPDEIIEKLQGVIKQVSHIKPDRERLAQLKTEMLVSDVITQEKFHYFGIMMADEIAIGGIDNLVNRWKMLDDVSSEDVRQAASRYLDGANYVATSFVPGEIDKEELRSEPRKNVEKKVLPNGFTILIESSEGSDVFAMTLFARGRTFFEPADKTGLSEFLSRLLLRGTNSRSLESLSREIRSIGADITVVDNPAIPYDDIYTTPAYSFVKFQTIGKFHDKAIEILSDIIRNPSLEENEIEKVRDELESLIKQAEKSSSKEGKAILMENMFQRHPFAKRILGENEHVSGINREDLVEFHSKLYSPKNLILAVVTDLSTDMIVKEIEDAFSGDFGAKEEFESYPVPLPLEERRELIVEKDSKQAYIYIGYILPGVEDPHIPHIIAMNSILSSRLGLALREKEGLAYSVGSSVEFDRDFGYLVISMGTAGESVEKAKSGILSEIGKLIEEGVTGQELRRAVGDYRGDLLRKRMSRVNKAYYMARDEYLGWEGEDVLYERMSQLGVEDIKEAAGRYLSTDVYVLIIVK